MHGIVAVFLIITPIFIVGCWGNDKPSAQTRDAQTTELDAGDKDNDDDKDKNVESGNKIIASKTTATPLTNTPLTATPLTNTPLTNTPLTNTPLTNTPLTNTKTTIEKIKTDEDGTNTKTETSEINQVDGTKIIKKNKIIKTPDGKINKKTSINVKNSKGKTVRQERTEMITDKSDDMKSKVKVIKVPESTIKADPIIHSSAIPKSTATPARMEGKTSKTSKTININKGKVTISPEMYLCDPCKGNRESINLSRLLAHAKSKEGQTIPFDVYLQFDVTGGSVKGKITSINVKQGGKNVLENMDPDVNRNIQLDLNTGTITYNNKKFRTIKNRIKLTIKCLISAGFNKKIIEIIKQLNDPGVLKKYEEAGSNMFTYKKTTGLNYALMNNPEIRKKIIDYICGDDSASGDDWTIEITINNDKIIIFNFRDIIQY